MQATAERERAPHPFAEYAGCALLLVAPFVGVGVLWVAAAFASALPSLLTNCP